MDVFGNDINPFIQLLIGPLLGFLVVLILVFIAFFIVLIIGRIKLFIKSGQPGWKAIIPFYGTYIQDVKIAGLHWAFFILEETWFFGLYSSVLIIIVKIMSFYNLAKKCHKDPVATTIFGALFTNIVIMVYGYSSSIIYDEKEPVSNCGIFDSIIK